MPPFCSVCTPKQLALTATGSLSSLEPTASAVAFSTCLKLAMSPLTKGETGEVLVEEGEKKQLHNSGPCYSQQQQCRPTTGQSPPTCSVPVCGSKEVAEEHIVHPLENKETGAGRAVKEHSQ